MHDKHLDYFLNFTEQAAPHLIRAEQLDWLAQLDADHENIRMALEWALSQESAEPSLRLCSALGKFWQIRCYWLEGSNWLQEALTKATPIPGKPEQRVRVRALYWDVFLADELDDFDKMKRSGERCYGLAQEVSNPLEIAIARLGVGRYLYRREDYEGAFSMLEKSYADLQELKSFYWAALSYQWLGNILDGRETALARIDEALARS